MKHIATCLCEQLKVEYQGDITQSSLCHCYGCQKRSGSVFGAQVLLSKENLTITGGTQTYTHTSDEGHPVVFYSCPRCFSTVYWQISVFPDHLAVAVGCFADKEFAAPTFSVYEDRKHAWVQLPDTITEHMD